MFIECPKCLDEIDVNIISLGTSGNYFEPPEPAEYDFESEHPCADSWTDAEQEIFDNRVWESMDSAYSEPDFF